jgi:glycosyltransferase involved in cell wall biosynthesis
VVEHRLKYERDIYEHANRTVAMTGWDRNYLGLFLHPDRIINVPCGIDPHTFPPVDKDFARSWSSECLEVSRKYMLFYAGRLDPRKGIHIAIRGIAATGLQSDILFVIAGDAQITAELEYKTELIRLADRLGVRVHFLGVVKRNLHLWYASALAVLVPSLYEPFGLVPLEAMASGTPVICSGEGPKETVLDRATGLHVVEGDSDGFAAAIRTVINDQALRHRMEAFARQHVLTNYTWDVSVEKLVRAFPTA